MNPKMNKKDNIIVIGKYFEGQKKAQAYLNKKKNPRAFIIVELGEEGRMVLPKAVLDKPLSTTS